LVPSAGPEAGDRELRDTVDQRSADFWVLRKLRILAEVPKSATGKLRRIGWAEMPGITQEKFGD